MNRTLWHVIWAVLLLPYANCAQTQRGVVAAPRPAISLQSGAYYALVIGINEYQHWPRLHTAVNDAQALDTILRERYRFQTSLLVDGAATRTNILNAFGEYRRRLRENDNLLIYYAGHGARDGAKAYWLPVDSDPNSTANWIIADDVTNGVSVIPARHVLIISDSCYSGGISRDVNANTAPVDHNNYIQTMLSSKSRVLISSGRDEPVTDSGSGGHSVFANAVLNGLRSMPEQPFTALNLFSRYVQESVVGNSAQVPLYQMIPNSGHEYGDFVFMARSVATAGGAPIDPNPLPDRSIPVPPPKTGAAPGGAPAPAAHIERKNGVTTVTNVKDPATSQDTFWTVEFGRKITVKNFQTKTETVLTFSGPGAGSKLYMIENRTGDGHTAFWNGSNGVVYVNSIQQANSATPPDIVVSKIQPEIGAIGLALSNFDDRRRTDRHGQPILGSSEVEELMQNYKGLETLHFTVPGRNNSAPGVNRFAAPGNN